MNKIFNLLINVLLIFTLVNFYAYKVYAEDAEAILKHLQMLQKDVKTLEKVVYSQDIKTTFNSGDLSSDNSDILTKHLLKLSTKLKLCQKKNN